MTIELTDVEKRSFTERFEEFRQAVRVELAERTEAFQVAVGVGLASHLEPGDYFPYDYNNILNDGSKPDEAEDYVFEEALTRTYAYFENERVVAHRAVERRLALDPPDTAFAAMVTPIFGEPPA